eukprot:2293964-Rhodomonas_salina.1
MMRAASLDAPRVCGAGLAGGCWRAMALAVLRKCMVESSRVCVVLSRCVVPRLCKVLSRRAGGTGSTSSSSSPPSSLKSPSLLPSLSSTQTVGPPTAASVSLIDTEESVVSVHVSLTLSRSRSLAPTSACDA